MEESTESANIQNNKKGKKHWHWTGIALLVLVIICIGTAAFFSIDHVSRTNPKFCATCHNMESHVDSYLSGSYLDNFHYQANVGCKECHSDFTLLQEMHSVVSFVTGKYDDPMREADFSKEGCLQCHISYTSLAEKTSHLEPNPHSSHLGEIDCTLCHKSHRPSEIYCSQCHNTE
ncbi:MAG: cytochrome c3 family protein, partial [Anaerolineaceae bacterium]|nr:cytochrome c3 family protein [Anaerolineaceae bacterium]